VTGGSLPAQTWHDIMEYAHQGIELKSIPSPRCNRRLHAPAEASQARPTDRRAPHLTKRGTDILVRVERLMDDAARWSRATSPRPSRCAATPTRPAMLVCLRPAGRHGPRN
jgi:penicillin-binding protein 1A